MRWGRGGLNLPICSIVLQRRGLFSEPISLMYRFSPVPFRRFRFGRHGFIAHIGGRFFKFSFEAY